VAEDLTTSQQAAYHRIHDSDDFAVLRKRIRGFAFAGTAAFMAWYLLYVLLSSFAVGFMSVQVVGNINIALIFGLLQFASTFLIAVLYSKYAASQLDPISAGLLAEYDKKDV
jgi:uncharacterized membrane protein (DUF485 family)